jgi:hypothetical protein
LDKLDLLDFQDLDQLVFWNWTLVVFRDMDLDFWIWTFSTFQDRIQLVLRIWMFSDFLGFGSVCLDLDSVAFLQDIGVDRDTKMLISSSLPFAFRAVAVFLRRLVISPRFSVNDFPGSRCRGHCE